MGLEGRNSLAFPLFGFLIFFFSFFSWRGKVALRTRFLNPRRLVLFCLKGAEMYCVSSDQSAGCPWNFYSILWTGRAVCWERDVKPKSLWGTALLLSQPKLGRFPFLLPPPKQHPAEICPCPCFQRECWLLALIWGAEGWQEEDGDALSRVVLVGTHACIPGKPRLESRGERVKAQPGSCYALSPFKSPLGF